MKEKWFGEKCKYQICQFESYYEGTEDRGKPVLVYCNNKKNKMDCEGNCYKERCPLLINK